MNIDKSIVMVGILLSSILVIENLAVQSGTGYLFVKPGVSVGVVLLVTLIIGIFLGYGLRGFLSSDKKEVNNDDYDF